MIKQIITFLVAVCCCSFLRGNDQTNVIVIYADDLGYGDLGCYGATKVQTPNIDRLAREGRRLTDAHSASAVCSPSRYALMTGEYPFRKKKGNAWGPMGHTSPLGIDTSKLTLPRLFSDAGYATACIGKWHLGFGDKKADYNKLLKPGPLELGFDHFFGIATNNSENPFVYIEDHRVFGWDKKDPLRRNPDGKLPYDPAVVGRMSSNNYAGATEAHRRYDNRQTGTILSEKAVSWIAGHKDEPFFLYYAPPQIHHPFTPHPRFVGTSQCGMYGDFIHELDWMVGEVLNTLDELELAANTIVVFTSDNGGMFNMGGRQAFDLGHRQNANLLGFKFGVWEGGHRVPFLIRWPSHAPPSSESNQLFCSMDLLSTFAGLLGRSLKDTDAVDSFDQRETLTGNPASPVRKELLLSPRDKDALGLRQDNWVYIGVQGDGSGRFSQQQRGGAWAAAYTKTPQSDIASDGAIKPNAPKQQLYDLSKDLFQANNTAEREAPTVFRLSARLEELRSTLRTRSQP